jgi:predicted ribosome quality control (RQC) complex YloA/Tae2 family protein
MDNGKYPMDFIELKKSTAALQKLLTGSVIQYCNRFEAKVLEIVIANSNISRSFHTLLIDCGSITSGIFYMSKAIPKNTSDLLARSFGKKISGSTLASIKMPYPDRIISLELHLQEWPASRELWLEFFGVRSNVTLIDTASQEILECLSKVSENSKNHPLRIPGRRFQNIWDARKQKPRPLSDLIEQPNLISDVLTSNNPKQFLMNTFAPITPEFADDLLQKLTSKRDRTIDDCIPNFMKSAETALTSNDEAVDYLLSLSDRRQLVKRNLAFKNLKQSLLRIVKTSLERVNRTQTKLKTDLENLPDPSEIRNKADLLAINFHCIKPGMTEIELPNVLNPASKPSLIKLDPTKSPRQNIDRLYKKAGKAKRAFPQITERINTLHHEGCLLNDLLNKLNDADQIETLNDIRETLHSAGFFNKKSKSVSSQAMLSQKPYHRFTTKEGFHIWAGRSASENAMLSFQDASPHDFWLHAKDYKGAHVIMKNPDKLKEPPLKSIIYAAQLAVFYSKARGEKGVAVIVTQKKNIRPAPGKNPGLARVFRHQTLTVDSL